MSDSVMEEYFGNPGSTLLHLNYRYFNAIGQTRATDLTEECEVPDEVDILQMGGGDIRDILFTVSQLSQITKPPTSVLFYVNDADEAVLARNILLLKILDLTDPDNSEDMWFLWAIWYNAFLTGSEHKKLKVILRDLQQSFPEYLKYADTYSMKDIDKVFKYWSQNIGMNHQKVKKERDDFIKNYVGSECNENCSYSTAIEWLSTTESCIFSLDSGVPLFKKRVAELKSYLVSGASPQDGAALLDRVNLSFMCSAMKGWRVDPCGTPFHAYNMEICVPSVTLKDSCMMQLQERVRNWKGFLINGGQLKIKIAHNEPLVLCNCVLPNDQRFDFINTAQLCDEVGLMNLLVSCTHRLKRDGTLTVQTNKWTESYYTSFQAYLLDNLKCLSGFYPTLFNLQMAEDFTIGTCNPHKPSVRLSSQLRRNAVTTRWKSCSYQSNEVVDIQGSLELLYVFNLIVDTAFDYSLRPVWNLCASGIVVPLTVIYLIKCLQYKVKGGAKTLLDLVENRLPVAKAQTDMFKPSEVEWREIRHQFFPEIPQKKPSEPLIVVELEEFYCPKQNFQCPAGIKRQHQLILFSTINDKMTYITTQCKHNAKQTSVLPTSGPIAMSTIFKYNPANKTLSFLCPEHVYRNFGTMIPLVMEVFYNSLPTLMCRNSMYDDDTRGYSFDTEEVRYNGFLKKSVPDEGSQLKDENDNLQELFVFDKLEAEKCYNILVRCKKDNLEIADMTGGVQDKVTVQVTIQYHKVDGKTKDTEKNTFKGSITMPLPVKGKLKILHKTNHHINAQIEKDFSVLEGPLLLITRRRDIRSYPKLTWDMKRFGEAITGMFDTTRQMQRKGMLSGGKDKGDDFFLEFKNTLQIILVWVKMPPAIVRPKVCCYSLIRERRTMEGPYRDQECGKHDDEIFLAITGEHEMDGKLTLRVVWIDFEIYNKMASKGKVTKGDHLKFMRKYWVDDDEKSHSMYNTPEAARLFQTMLRVNSMKCVQGGDNGAGVWNLTSFLQPVYTVTEVEKPSKPGMFERTCPKVTHPLAVYLTRCHVCGSPVGRDVKGCKDCQAVEYCSQQCYDKDIQLHQIYCNKSVKGERLMKQYSEYLKPAETENPKKQRCSECGKKQRDLKKCSRCKAEAYCNQACQKKHWPKHKKICKQT